MFHPTYSTEALRTNAPDAGSHDVSPDFLHAALGIADETLELLFAVRVCQQYPHRGTVEEVLEEIGDSYWFANLLAWAPPLSLSGLEGLGELSLRSGQGVATDTLCHRLVLASHQLVGAAKRHYAYGKAPDVGTLEHHLLNYLYTLGTLCSHYGVSPAEVQRENLAKLQARFPERFDAARTENRSPEAEQAAIRDARDP